jgi:hypothetical protein
MAGEGIHHMQLVTHDTGLAFRFIKDPGLYEPTFFEDSRHMNEKM